VDPVVLVEEQKAKDERMRSAIEKLKTKIGPLSPSEAIAKAAIEHAGYNAIVKDPSKDDSNPKEHEQRAESTTLQKQETEEKAKAKAVERKRRERIDQFTLTITPPRIAPI
jgi:hypothetical protein